VVGSIRPREEFRRKVTRLGRSRQDSRGVWRLATEAGAKSESEERVSEPVHKTCEVELWKDDSQAGRAAYAEVLLQQFLFFAHFRCNLTEVVRKKA